MDNTNDNNHVTVAGIILEPFSFSHELHGEKFYSTRLSIERLSNQTDIIPVMFPERLIDVTQNYIGRYAEVSGQLRSHNLHNASKSKLLLFVFAREAAFFDERCDIIYKNQVHLSGYVSKPALYRKTPLKKEISNVLLAVNRPHLKADYIPCILWGSNALLAKSLQTGEHIVVRGRIQSREYTKTTEDGNETKTTYELSVATLEQADTAHS